MSLPPSTKPSYPGFIPCPSSTPPRRDSPPSILVRVPSTASPLPLSPSSPQLSPVHATSFPRAPQSRRTSFYISGSSNWSSNGNTSSEDDSPPSKRFNALRESSSRQVLRPASNIRTRSSPRLSLPRVPGGRTWCWLLSRLGFGRYNERTCHGDEWERLALMWEEGRKEIHWAELLWRLVPTRLEVIIGVLLVFFVFAAGLTIALCHILNPDKAPLPWKTYCAADVPTVYSLQAPSSSDSASSPALLPVTSGHPKWPYPSSSPPGLLDAERVEPVGVFVAVFTTAEYVERRHMIRQSYMSHWRSRRPGAESVKVQFVIGQPSSSALALAVQNEINAFNDIVILPIKENMNSGKTHAFFQWAAENATVPHYDLTSDTPRYMGEKMPHYVVKADDDSFIMLGELERHLRVAPRQMAFWGYLVKQSFMAGEAYAVSFDLVQYIADTPALRAHTIGKEDKLVSKWFKMHPEAEDIMWISERCWIYDHPKAGTVYSHGFLFPSYVASLRASIASITTRTASASTVSHFGSTFGRYFSLYKPPAKNLTLGQRIEALVEGSEMSTLRQTILSERRQDTVHDGRWVGDNLQEKIQEVYDRRLTRLDRFMGDEEERGGTVVVHFVKRDEWWVDTMLALLGGPEEPDGDLRGGAIRLASSSKLQEGEGLR